VAAETTTMIQPPSAPSNAAFNSVSSLTATLTTDQLADVLKYHVLSGSVNSTAAIAAANSAGEATTLQGSAVYLDVVGGNLYVNQAKAGPVDIPASNGVIHGLDAVILPPASIYSALTTYGLSELKTAVDTAGLQSALDGAGTFTVFAPTNAAFQAIASTTATLNATQLGDILEYHVLTSVVKASGAIAAAGTTLNGASITPSLSGTQLRINGSATVMLFNIRCTNGVVHVIDAVLIPPAPGPIPN
jgi:transforming growth factor-beta-induced protein